MTIGLISDTDGVITDDVLVHLQDCDEVWHGGDLGNIGVLKQAEELGVPFRAVYGNIDDAEMRRAIPLNLDFVVNGLHVFITHIGGYPPKYTARVRALLASIKPDIYICGHSHICRVMRDPDLEVLHMNPGACGHIGFHNIRTMLKFEIEGGKPTNLRAVEFGKRGIIVP